MKINKLIVALTVVFLFASITFNDFFTVSGQDTVKIGIIGPVGLPHWSPGMKEAAEMARDEINAAGGVNVGGTMKNIELIVGNEYALPTPDPDAARAEVARLISEGAQFIIGGFRTEVTGPMIEVAMDFKVPFFICGASTDELLPNMTDPAVYARYKYLFRDTPVNSTMLFKTIAGYLAAPGAVGGLIEKKLLPMYGTEMMPGKKQVKIAVITEDLAWTATMHYVLTNPSIYPTILGPYVNVTYQARIPETATDVSAYLTALQNSGARLVIHVFSGRAGLAFITQWSAMGVKALPVGINVLAQIGTHWVTTGGKCEFECILNFVGTRTTIIPGVTDVFWDKFLNKTKSSTFPDGFWPIYTAFGMYDGVYALKEAIEKAGTTDADTLVPVLEATNRTGLTGRFAYTAGHDVFTLSYAPIWTDPYTRAMVVQWIAGRMEVVSPVYYAPPPHPLASSPSYSRKTRIPPWMYDLADWDLDFSGRIDILDVARAAKAFGTDPSKSRWDLEADVNVDGTVNIIDLAGIAKNFGKAAPQWPLE